MNICPIVALKEVDSTNTYAKEHFHELADGTLVTAFLQTAGRGRFCRNWISPPGVNFYGSAVLKSCTDPFGATQALSLAALDTLSELVPGLEVYIKWPNDLYVGRAKLAGMLCESVTTNANQLSGVVAGLGVNLNMTHEALAGIDQAATSVFAETGKQINPVFFAKKLAFYLNQRYIIYSNNPEIVFSEWRKANKLIGKSLEIIGMNCVKRGVFIGVDDTGEMLLKTADGIEKINSGDVHISKNSFNN